MTCTTSRRWTIAIGALVLCSIVCLSVFLFSSWHKHTRASSSDCAFSAFEHGTYTDECGVALPPEPAAQCVWFLASGGPGGHDQVVGAQDSVRAPPTV